MHIYLSLYSIEQHGTVGGIYVAYEFKYMLEYVV